MSLPTAPPPGYYPDPSGPGQRWWDGTQWTSHVGAVPTADPFATASVTPAVSRSARDWTRVAIVAVVVLALIAAMSAYRAVTRGGGTSTNASGSGLGSGSAGGAGPSAAPQVLGPPMTSEPAPNGSVVTPDQASQVLHAFWPVHEQALVGRDLRLLSRLDTGAAAAYEPGALACGCLMYAHPRTLQAASYVVPGQVSYPAHFLAEAQWAYDGTTSTDVLVFTKSAAGRPWLLAEESGYRPKLGSLLGLGQPQLLNGGYALPLQTQQHALARTLAPELARLWQTTRQSRHIPTSSVFNLTGQLGARLHVLVTHPQDGVLSTGERAHYTFYVDPADQLYEFADSDNDIACQVVREKVVYTNAKGGYVVQDAARRNWGPFLAPGRYRTVTSRDTWQTCFVVSPTGQPVVVLDSEVGGSIVTAP